MKYKGPCDKESSEGKQGRLADQETLSNFGNVDYFLDFFRVDVGFVTHDIQNGRKLRTNILNVLCLIRFEMECPEDLDEIEVHIVQDEVISQLLVGTIFLFPPFFVRFF